MRLVWGLLFTLAALLLGAILLFGGDAPVEPSRSAEPSALVQDLLADLEEVEDKIVALAEALSEEQYAWRPMDGVRAAGEVFVHVAADNYFLPVLAGHSAPQHTGITSEYSTVRAFENRVLAPDETVRHLRESFTFLKAAIARTDVDQLGREIDIFGQTGTLQGLWITTATHVHEHLGQSIAYARANGVIPPWSR